MPITGGKYAFTESNVNKAPAEHGVYALYDNTPLVTDFSGPFPSMRRHRGELTIYIGRASGDGVTIRSRLKSHYRGDEGLCTVAATHYRREVTSDPIARESELLDEYEEKYSALPRCLRASALQRMADLA
jgi:hypothetical protein